MVSGMKIICVIPARYKSTRLPGKPLALISGKPMIYWVYKNASRVFEHVYVATDDKRIEKECRKLGLNCIMTKSTHATGTDRVAEVAEKIKGDLYINVQGDEPLLDPEIMRAVVPPFEDPEVQVVNLIGRIKDCSEVINPTIPKVVVNDEGWGVFTSRSPIPFPQKETDIGYYKQVCVYGFRPEALEFFKNTERGRIEKCEDLEILRFIEHGRKVKYVGVESDNIAVDTPKDLERVRKIFNELRTI